MAVLHMDLAASQCTSLASAVVFAALVHVVREPSPDLSPRSQIFISLFQVLNMIGPALSIRFPPLYTELLAWLSLLELNPFQLMPFGCVLCLAWCCLAPAIVACPAVRYMPRRGASDSTLREEVVW